jgi:hypothetical protein
LRELFIAQREVLGKGLAPGFNSLEKSVVNGGRAALGFIFLGVFIEGALQDSVAGEDAGDFVPARCIFSEGNIEDAGYRGFVFLVGLDPAIIDGKLLKVGKDAEGQFSGPGVTAELKGRAGVILYVNGGPFGLKEKLAGTADAKRIVGGTSTVANF